MIKTQFPTWMGIVIGILIISVIILTIHPLFNNNSNKENISEINKECNRTIEINNTEIEEIKDNFSNVEELHWTHMPITYKFENECSGRQINLTILAFKKIENETKKLINFTEASENPDISIYCKQRIFVSNSEKIVLGDALLDKSGYDEYNNLITHVEITFYGQGMTCNTGYPALEVHEILHGFGLIDDKVLDKIMSRYSSDSSKECKIKNIDTKYLSCLKHIYSNGEIYGNCSNIVDEVCKKGYIVSYLDNKCYKDCEEGYVFGQDNLCHEECEAGYYCGAGFSCCQNECYEDCPMGSYFGTDCNCK